MVVILSNDPYKDLGDFARAHQIDPRTAEAHKHLIVVGTNERGPVLIGNGLKVSCDGTILVLRHTPEPHQLFRGVPILGTGGDDEDDDGRVTTVQLAGNIVADGDAYSQWRHRQHEGRFGHR